VLKNHTPNLIIFGQEKTLMDVNGDKCNKLFEGVENFLNDIVKTSIVVILTSQKGDKVRKTLLDANKQAWIHFSILPFKLQTSKWYNEIETLRQVAEGYKGSSGSYPIFLLEPDNLSRVMFNNQQERPEVLKASVIKNIEQGFGPCTLFIDYNINMVDAAREKCIRALKVPLASSFQENCAPYSDFYQNLSRLITSCKVMKLINYVRYGLYLKEKKQLGFWKEVEATNDAKMVYKLAASYYLDYLFTGDITDLRVGPKTILRNQTLGIGLIVKAIERAHHKEIKRFHLQLRYNHSLSTT